MQSPRYNTRMENSPTRNNQVQSKRLVGITGCVVLAMVLYAASAPPVLFHVVAKLTYPAGWPGKIFNVAYWPLFKSLEATGTMQYYAEYMRWWMPPTPRAGIGVSVRAAAGPRKSTPANP